MGPGEEAIGEIVNESSSHYTHYRAVYRNADVYLLDDPLSAVDAAVSRHIFEKLAIALSLVIASCNVLCSHCRCIRGLLCNQCVVLVTHQLQYVQQCDTVLVLKEVSHHISYFTTITIIIVYRVSRCCMETLLRCSGREVKF